MPTVRAKFKVHAKELRKGYDQAHPIVSTITLQPVVGGSEENKQFFASTPCGQIQLQTISQAAADAFELDKDYYIDFTPAN